MTASVQEVETGTVDALRSALDILAAKAPDEIDSYKQLVLGVSTAVAEAKGGGVIAAEAAAIEKIKGVLG